MRSPRSIILGLLIASVLLASCGTGTTTTDSTPRAAGVRLVTPQDGAGILNDPPDNLVVLDVRTAEEFDAGHIEGATMIDFYGDEFSDRIAELDPETPYLLYCRSGNRSGQTRDLMKQLGFSDVADIDGGVAAWTQAGLPLSN